MRALLHTDFREFGASGRIWDRDSVSDAISTAPVDVTMSELDARSLGPDIALVTYRSDDGRRQALRSSVWVRQGEAWLLVFHQGTPVAAR